MSDKKKMQLGMNPSTASHRLVKDVLWSLIVKTGQQSCCKCGVTMDRETFSIEHLEPWLDSDDPVGLYFDLENIGFSHLRCNVEDRRIERKEYTCGTKEAYRYRQCRCSPCVEANASARAPYDPTERRERYERLGS
ncbi:hypothetical protein vBPFY1MI_34 [Pseudomonas phage vB_PF_Y1-MI]|nr:hypothetical protein vBPFY1MI_34 [Pseudomonas phage vB_PF_Y1-MI]